MADDPGAAPLGRARRRLRWGPGRRRSMLDPRVLLAALASLAVALAYFTRFSLTGQLSRDESIYAYAAQQLAHGVPPYVSIFDPKGPVAAAVGAVAILVGRPLGLVDLSAIRLAYLAATLLCVLLVFAVATRLWRTALAGLGAAVVLAGFHGFAADALAGPDAKTPGLVFMMAALLAAGHRRWFWAGVLASCATLTWQPFVFIIICVVVTAAVALDGRPGERRTGRGRLVPPALVVAGAAVPGVATLVAFLAARAGHALFEAALLYPLTGTPPHTSTILQRITYISGVVHRAYGTEGAVLVPVGLALLPVAAWLAVRARDRVAAAGLEPGDAEVRPVGGAWRDPLAFGVVLAMLSQVAYALYDFQGYPDVFPLLPFAALGVAGGATVLVRLVPGVGRRVAAGVAVAGLVVVAAITWPALGSVAGADPGLAGQRSAACAVAATSGKHPFYSLGNPVPFVLTHRRSPDRFIYLAGQVDRWQADHYPGGFDAWIAHVAGARPSVVVVDGWPDTPLRAVAKTELGRYGYTERHLGGVDVFVDASGRHRARAAGLRLTKRRTPEIRGTAAGSTWTCSRDMGRR